MNPLEILLHNVTAGELLLSILCLVSILAFNAVDNTNQILREGNYALNKMLKEREDFAAEVVAQNMNVLRQNQMAAQVITFLEKKIGGTQEEIYGPDETSSEE